MTGSPMNSTQSYGFFDDQAKAYVITSPQTPYPWINYLGYTDFFGMVSNTGGGYSFYRDAKLRRLTRYRYNNVPVDSGGRYFYIRDGEHKWSPTWKPLRGKLDSFRCEHGLGRTRFLSSLNQLHAELSFFVPLGETCEIHRLTLHNKSKETKSVHLTSFAEWCLWNAQDDMSNFQRNFSTGEVAVDESILFHLTEFRERRNHFAFYGVNHPIVGFETDREAFLGPEGDFSNPHSFLYGPSNHLAHGWSPIASHFLSFSLKPGESKDLTFVLGYVEVEEKWVSGQPNLEPAKALMQRFSAKKEVEKAYADLDKHWNDQLGIFQLEIEDKKLARLVNIWNPYQCVVTFNMARSASLFESGVSRGIGFRDSNQDQLGAVHIMPERSRQRILDLAATQYADGSADHQYQPLTKKGNSEIGSGFNDDPLWLILSSAAYIKETGDWSLLEEKVPFTDKFNPGTTLFDHLHASFQHVLDNLGPHGLPLIGRADWNDCLNLNCFSQNPDEAFQTTDVDSESQAESLMIGGLFLWVSKDFLAMCRKTKRDNLAQKVESAIQDMVRNIEEHGWDGRWFLRAYDHHGKKVGSSENREGQIFVESQAWCVMGGVGHEDGRAELAMDSVNAFLECEHGVVVLYPAYSKYYPELGEISSYPQGYKENGAVFCHTNPWVMIAETMLGRGAQAFELLRKFSPPWRETLSSLNKTEPYVFAQMIAGKEAFKPGESKNSWLTGTASWAFYATTQFILGIRPDWDGLRIDPCIPPEWNGFTVKRTFRGVSYEIEIENPDHVSKGIARLYVNGKALQGNLIPAQGEGLQRVRVIMG